VLILLPSFIDTPSVNIQASNCPPDYDKDIIITLIIIATREKIDNNIDNNTY
jgi:hypothetical protein